MKKLTLTLLAILLSSVLTFAGDVRISAKSTISSGGQSEDPIASWWNDFVVLIEDIFTSDEPKKTEEEVETGVDLPHPDLKDK